MHIKRILTKEYTIWLMLVISALFSQGALADKTSNFPELEILRTILEQNESQLDIARIKLIIDKLIDHSVNIEAELDKINKMASAIRHMIPSNATPMERISAIKKYLYTPGVWNNYTSYQYDFDDPLGTKVTNKLLPNYIDNKKGNCITMPFLFIILGDRLGVNVRASLAPLHVFVKFVDSDGNAYNLEATSGANFSRDEWYRKQMPMTDEAIENGIYLQTLTRKETIIVMMMVLAEYYAQQKEHKKSIGIASLLLEHYPKYANAMLRMGHEFSQLLNERFITKYPDPNDIPMNQRELFQLLSNGTRYWFAKAEELGWREPDPDYDADYLRRVKKDANNKK